MSGARALAPLAAILAGGVAGCDAGAPQVARFAPEYRSVETRLLDGDLVNFHVTMRGARSGADVSDFADCAAAQYTLIRGYGFARHLRTNVTEQAGLWHGDAVYTISAQLPRGAKTIDAEIVAADCAENGIPMV